METRASCLVQTLKEFNLIIANYFMPPDRPSAGHQRAGHSFHTSSDIYSTIVGHLQYSIVRRVGIY